MVGKAVGGLAVAQWLVGQWGSTERAGAERAVSPKKPEEARRTGTPAPPFKRLVMGMRSLPQPNILLLRTYPFQAETGEMELDQFIEELLEHRKSYCAYDEWQREANVEGAESDVEQSPDSSPQTSPNRKEGYEPAF